MRLSLDWTLELRPTALPVRVSAEIVRRVYLRSVDMEAEDVEARDPWQRAVPLSPEEEQEAEAALLSDAELVEWCSECGRERAGLGGACDDCWRRP